MIVKTKIINPTDQKQRYSWIPKHGAFIAAKSEMIIEGDVYTLAERIVKSRQCIDVDMTTGRVKIVLITDFDTEHPDKVAKVEEKKVEEKKVEKKPVREKKAVSIVDKNIAVKSKEVKPKGKASVEDYNILGQGLQEGSIEEAKPKALNPFTNEEVIDDIPEAENVSDFLWGEDAAKEEVPVLEDVPTVYTKSDLKKKLKTDLVELAAEMGMPDVEEVKKSEIIDWILKNQ